MTRIRIAVALVVLGALTACGADRQAGSDTIPSRPGADERIDIDRSRFSATELEVGVGASVVFVNNDAAAHTVTAADGAPESFDSGDLGLDETFTVTFGRAGTYDYFCRIHPTMRATVVVG